MREAAVRGSLADWDKFELGFQGSFPLIDFGETAK